jgi:2-phosphosulfolactate phosphatase
MPPRVRFGWGPNGLAALSAEVVVIVDVLRFSTAVDAAVARGVVVQPARWRQALAAAASEAPGALPAAGGGRAGGGKPSLSPASLAVLPAGTRVVLPSPNGATCSLVAAESGATVVAACLRNATAVAQWIPEQRGTVAVIACGERWPDGSLRPALEDLLGAGAVLSQLAGVADPDPRAAAAVFRDAEADLLDVLLTSGSGKELVERGARADVVFAAALDASAAVPVLRDGAFVDVLAEDPRG